MIQQPLKIGEARKAARQLKAVVEQGKDPAADTRARRNAPNVDSLCERYFEEHAKIHKKPRSAKEDHRMIDKRIKPTISTMKAAAVNGGASLPITGALLGHRAMQTTQCYSRISQSPLKKAADDVTARMQAAIEAGERHQKAVETAQPFTKGGENRRQHGKRPLTPAGSGGVIVKKESDVQNHSTAT